MYDHVIRELKSIQMELKTFLSRGRELRYQDMKQVSPGIWIHKKYVNLSECLAELRAWIP